MHVTDTGADLGVTYVSIVGSKTYLDLPSLAYDYEYSIVICADDDEYAGRGRILQRVCLIPVSLHS